MAVDNEQITTNETCKESMKALKCFLEKKSGKPVLDLPENDETDFVCSELFSGYEGKNSRIKKTINCTIGWNENEAWISFKNKNVEDLLGTSKIYSTDTSALFHYADDSLEFTKAGFHWKLI